jgi:hypothetical protein
MTIRRGEPWGDVGPLPVGTVVARSDAEVSAIVTAARRSGGNPPPVALLGGDLMRAVGGTGDEGRLAGEVARMPIDVVRATSEDTTGWFVAHLVGRRSWWRGEVVAAMNAQHVGRWDVAPRGHPDDGRIEIVRIAPTMTVRDRWRASRRAVHGAHVPHPDIEIVTVRSTDIRTSRPLRWWLDGRPWRSASDVDLTVEPDSLIVCV